MIMELDSYIKERRMREAASSIDHIPVAKLEA
jgi:hypothetical protein